MKKLFIIFLSFIALNTYSQTPKNWCILYYAAGSNSSETDLLSDIAEMKAGKKSKDYHLITLIDRIEGHSEDSSTLDGNFNDSRLYQIEHNSLIRLKGREFFPKIGLGESMEVNMGDAMTLKKFIQYGKKHFPAKHYLLIIRSHGNGVGMCADAEAGERDKLYPAEITNILGKSESVDILGLDVCSMAGLENLYQWRPENESFSANYIIASSPLSGAWAYDRILERINDKVDESVDLDENNFEGGKEEMLDPKSMDPLALSELIFEEIYDNQRWASWALIDNTKSDALKQKIDEAAKLLAKEDKTTLYSIMENTLGYYHNTSNNIEIAQLTFPYLDAYHFWELISTSNSLGEESKNIAKEVNQLIDELVIHSYYGRGYLPETNHFNNGKNGVYLILPLGNKIFTQSGQTFWSHCTWFHPEDQSNLEDAYGQYDWCKNAAIPGNQVVDNFFELLDYLFEESNSVKGGVNQYSW